MVSEGLEETLRELISELGVTRRLLDPTAGGSFTVRVEVEALFRESSEARDWDAAPLVRDSSIRSNLRFLDSMAYDMLVYGVVWTRLIV